MFDVVTIGNAIIDQFLSLHEANVHCRLNEKDCELCVKYGEKILLDGLLLELGGNASNVAVGLSRMGFKTALVAEIGDDEFAQKIIKKLQKEQVDIDSLIQTPDAKTSLSIAISYRNERTLFVEHVHRSHQFSFDKIQTQWMYLTSLGHEWHDAYQRAFEFAQKNNVKIVFNPGTVQLEKGATDISDILSFTQMLFINKEEAETIVYGKEQKVPGDTEKEQMRELLGQLHKKGPKIITITDGENGSFVIDEDGAIYSIGLFPQEPLEKTGAGDSYATGFLAAHLKGLPVTQSMRWGSANAASVIHHVGAQKGLLTEQEMKDMLEKNNGVQAQKL